VRESLVKLFSQVRHGGRQKLQGCVQAVVKRVESSGLGRAVGLHDGLDGLEVDSSDFLVPEIVDTLSHHAKVVGLEAMVGADDDLVESGQDPFISQR